jgi:hypothetical protein
MHLLKHGAVQVGGVGRIVGINFWPEIRGAVDHLRRLERRQVAPVTEAEAHRLLASACPCWNMEHRMGVCPMGLSHRIEDHGEKKNTVTTALKKSVIDQMVGNASPTALLVARIATGTSSAATNVASTTLGAEVYRDTPTYLDDTTSTQMQVFWYFGPDKANTGSLLHEWGIFGGTATGTANSGTMLARFVQQFDKNLGTAVNGQYTFNVS